MDILLEAVARHFTLVLLVILIVGITFADGRKNDT